MAISPLGIASLGDDAWGMGEETLQSWNNWMIGIVVFAIFLVIFDRLGGFKKDPRHAESLAYVAARERAESMLLAPATAKFPWGPDHVANHGKGRYTVQGHVDAENAFGTVVQSNFQAEVAIQDDQQVEITEFEMH